MENHVMETNVTFKVKNPIEREVIDFRCNVEHWNYLESFWSHDLQTISYFRWAYTRPGDKFLSRVIVTIGEWNKNANQSNRYFVKASKFMADYDKQSLYKTHTFDSTQALVNKLAEKTNKLIEKNDWETKYPEYQRYGIKPTEMELEQMSKIERAKLPKVIHYD